MASKPATLSQKVQEMQRQQDPKIQTIRSYLKKIKDQVAVALPQHLSPDRMLRISMTTIQRNPKLLECDIKSLLGSIIEAAQLGLEPDGVMGRAYLVPYKDRRHNRTVAQLIVGYKGLIELARRSGQITSICAHVVYENDILEFEYGLNEKLKHIPSLKDRGKPIGAYAIARLKDGGHAFEFMPIDEIEGIRKRSKAAQDGPWVTDWSEMARKTVIRRLAKFLPLSAEFNRAVAIDELQERGATIKWDDGTGEPMLDLEQPEAEAFPESGNEKKEPQPLPETQTHVNRDNPDEKTENGKGSSGPQEDPSVVFERLRYHFEEAQQPYVEWWQANKETIKLLPKNLKETLRNRVKKIEKQRMQEQ